MSREERLKHRFIDYSFGRGGFTETVFWCIEVWEVYDDTNTRLELRRSNPIYPCRAAGDEFGPPTHYLDSWLRVLSEAEGCLLWAASHAESGNHSTNAPDPWPRRRLGRSRPVLPTSTTGDNDEHE